MRFNFTKRAIDALPTPPRRVYHYDTRTRGLALAVNPSSHKVFLLYRWIQRRPERITLGRYPDLSIERARGRAQELNASIARGENPADRRRIARAEMTLGELFTLYLEKYARVHKRSWRQDEGQFNLHLADWRARRLSSLLPADLAALHARVGRDHGHYTANRLLALLHTVFNLAITWGWQAPNPAHGLRRFPEVSRERFLSGSELRRFFRALALEPNPAMRDLFLLCLLTGARRGNVQAMRWEDIDGERHTWRIPETKPGGAHTVPLVGPAVAVLRARRRSQDECAAERSEFVFPGWGRSGHLEEPRAAWLALLKRAHLRDLRLHDLRRTLGSWQASTGSSLPIIGKTLGHRTPSTTQIYARLNLEPVRASLETATQALLEAGGAEIDLSEEGHD